MKDIDAGQYTVSMFLQLFTVRSQQRAPAGTQEQFRTKFRLQRLHPRCNIRLHKIQFRSRSADAPRSSDAVKYPKILELHRIPSPWFYRNRNLGQYTGVFHRDTMEKLCFPMSVIYRYYPGTAPAVSLKTRRYPDCFLLLSQAHLKSLPLHWKIYSHDRKNLRQSQHDCIQGADR